ncbi:MAG: FGGY-family carbohydrate kinase [Terriglobia bacterium]
MTPSNLPIVLGIDVGTSGVRSLAATADGEVLAEARAALSDLPAARCAHEQDADAWWRAVCHTLQELRTSLGAGARWSGIAGIAVTSTSGSLVLADSQGEPVRPAILYDDGRAGAVASELNRRLPPGQAPVNASFSLAKALWVRQEESSVWERASYVLHPADWLTGKLTGRWGVGDYSNALKLGYDQEKSAWTAAVNLAEIPASMLPSIVAPGDEVGGVSQHASEQTGLTAGVPVLAGASDGMASLIGSGAREPGHANTTLGTTLVWKVLTPVKPRLGPGMYCHYLPSHLWAPGAASNTGPGSLQIDEPGIAAAEMDRRAAPYLPTAIQCYLLGARGERFPFLNPQAQTFFDGRPASPSEKYAAQLQSLGYIERWGYERLEACGVTVGQQVFSAGGAAASPVLSQLRANTMNRTVVRCANPTASFGAAILAAGTVLFGGDLTAAIRSMTRVSESYAPEVEAVGKFEKAYQMFRTACANHGFE